MRPWNIIDHERVPDDDAVLYLVSRGSEYTIRVDHRELMSNTAHGSEDALAEYACAALENSEDPTILIGGLGMGFTLAAALNYVGSAAQVTVAELIPAVVRWNREHVGRAAGYPLDDPRVSVFVGDVIELVETPPAPWSAILLDVDNGPYALTRPANGWLYTREGLIAAREALIPGGILAIWSALGSASLTRRLKKAGFKVEVIRYVEDDRPTQQDGGVHFLWLARR